MKTKTKKILVVDDSADDRLLTKKILEKHGYEIIEARNWIEALNCVDKGDIDLILLDLRMPEMDGFELLGIIRKYNSSKELPIIIYTSVSAVGASECALRGSNDFVRKYSDPKILLDKVEIAFSSM
jgi:chemosensory pili system protein ChpA (sensor histidine kinase/response regulator)